tara:strand:- start:164 stop:430 length:267 start_codon:yes stop_codon:yes gene_type:complete
MGCVMCVKDEKEDIIKRSERVRERHKNGTARVVVFERETCEKEDEKSYRFHIIVSKIQTRDESPQNQDIIIIITTNARKQRERKKEHI